MMKRGTYIVNTARGKIVDRDAVVRALESGQLAGYAGDVWFPQPPPKDHPWRTMPHHGMTRTSPAPRCRRRPATPPARARSWRAISPRSRSAPNILIVDKGKLAGAGAHSYTAGDATKGSEEA